MTSRKFLLVTLFLFAGYLQSFCQRATPQQQIVGRHSFSAWGAGWTYDLFPDSSFTYVRFFDYMRYQPIKGRWTTRGDTILLTSNIQPDNASIAHVLEITNPSQNGLLFLFKNANGDTLRLMNLELVLNDDSVSWDGSLRPLFDTSIPESLRVYSKSRDAYIESNNPYYVNYLNQLQTIRIHAYNLIWRYPVRKVGSNFFEFWLEFPQGWRYPGADRYFLNTRFILRKGELFELE